MTEKMDSRFRGNDKREAPLAMTIRKENRGIFLDEII
jgi:hypothetical protein